MAFSTVIRRSAPLALRLLAGQRSFHCSGGALRIATRKFLVPLVSPARYSTSTAVSTRITSDGSFLQLINSEIDCCQQSYEEDEGVPEGFAFQVKDNLGQQAVLLTREFEGETIRIEVRPSDLFTEDSDADDDDDQASSQSTLPMVIKVSKPGAPGLEIEISVSDEKVVIDSLTVKDPELTEGQEPFEGPAFDELDGKIQEAFYKYLEVRGITASATNFLHQYMVNKEHKEYAHWLKNLQKYVAA
ncbi:uncharacterized protein At2g39795, mitochondrial-like [Bidens hawaiensis]|uniref:uncharacterized protein At2g39795, mitochondrial-like n=1 Tax=Bidens hawaiensis TaxID=980011 RepID=UPI00404B692A